MERELDGLRPGFPNTHWTSVFQAGRPQEQAGWEALGRLLEKYRQPLLEHLCWRFHAGQDQAEDWFHGFVETRILEKELLKQAQADGRGRFRNFLCCSLDNFVTDQIRRNNRACRRPEGGFQPLDEFLEGDGPTVATARSDPSDLAWAREVLDQATAKLEEFYRNRNRPDLWGIFDACFLQPTRDDSDPPPMSELAQRFGFQSAEKASNGLITAKRAFRQVLKFVVAEYAETDGEIEAELRDLWAILAGAG